MREVRCLLQQPACLPTAQPEFFQKRVSVKLKAELRVRNSYSFFPRFSMYIGYRGISPQPPLLCSHTT